MNNMDYEYCFKNNIHVLATSPVFAQPVAEMALGLTLSIARSIHIAHNDFIKGREKYGGAISKNNFLLKNKTFGFIGFGDLAKATLPLIRVFSNNILAYDPWISDSVIESKKVTPTSLNNIFKKSDIVYVYATSTTTNKEMIKLKNLNLFKDSSVILIMSRASVINFDDLYRFLKDRNVYAAIDVFPVEPKSNDEEFVSPLRDFDNCILTPHVGGSTMEAQRNIGIEVSEKLVRYSDNGSSFASVNFPEVSLPAHPGKHRLLHIHENVPGVLSQINSIFSENGINISSQYLQTNDKVGYVVMDVDVDASELALARLNEVNGTIKSRVLF